MPRKEPKTNRRTTSQAVRDARTAAGRRNLDAWNARRITERRTVAQAHDEEVANVDAIIARTVVALGGQDKLTPRQEHVLCSQKLALTVVHLANAHIRRKGLLVKRSRPDPILATIVSFSNTIRLNLQSLGLSDAPDSTHVANEEIAEIVAEIHKERNAQSS